jgi:hypothetical protein
MVQESLRKVVSEALVYVSKNGIPGDHHFYITFRTDRADVYMSDYLRQRHPEEITIVLQNQFWDLEVEQDIFRVSLSFNNIHERVAVPYTALVSFADPHVKFGLQFIPEPGPELEPSRSGKNVKKHNKKSKGTNGNNVIALDEFRNKT